MCINGLLLLIIFILVIVVVVMYKMNRKPVIIEIHTDDGEAFTYPELTIRPAILFTGYRLDKDDYEFVERWHKDIDFFVVVNGAPTEWDSKIVELIGSDRYINRENKGYDTTAWKEGLTRWYDELKRYDLVALVNNSCIYKVDLRSVFLHAKDYDMYGLGHTKGYGQWFLNTYFIVVGRALFNSDDFMDYWHKLPKINGYLDACVKHEWKFSRHFKDRGYKCGVYDLTNQSHSIHRADKKIDDKYHREFIKRKTIDRDSKAQHIFNENMSRLQVNGPARYFNFK